jgi:hypothetical protein
MNIREQRQDGFDGVCRSTAVAPSGGAPRRAIAAVGSECGIDLPTDRKRASTNKIRSILS